MSAAYKKPTITSYTTEDLIEHIGPCQNQYTNVTATFLTTTGNSSVNVDGDINSSGLVSTSGGVATGDDASNLYYRGFFGFDISSIQGRTIVSATLRIYQFNSMGTPYTSLGTIVVDHVNFGSSLGAGDFGTATGSDALTPSIGTISTSSAIEWKTLDVSSYVQTDINASRSSSQFRTRFTTNTDSDSGIDVVPFEDVENGGSTGNRPELVVTYR